MPRRVCSALGATLTMLTLLGTSASAHGPGGGHGGYHHGGYYHGGYYHGGFRPYGFGGFAPYHGHGFYAPYGGGFYRPYYGYGGGFYRPYYGYGGGLGFLGGLGGLGGLGLGGGGLGGLGLGGGGLGGLGLGGGGLGGLGLGGGLGGLGLGSGGYGGYAPSYGRGYGVAAAPVFVNASPPASVAGTPSPGQTPSRPDNAAHLQLIVPPNAEVLFDGAKTAQTGPTREFVSPPLQPDKVFHYRIRVRYSTAEGKPIDDSRLINVRANDWFRIDFNEPAPLEPPLAPPG